jgi:hypothetical protein
MAFRVLAEIIFTITLLAVSGAAVACCPGAVSRNTMSSNGRRRREFITSY